MSVVHVSFIPLPNGRSYLGHYPCPSFILHVWVVLTLPPDPCSAWLRSSVFLSLRCRDGIATQARLIEINFRISCSTIREKEAHILLVLPSKGGELQSQNF